MDISNPRYSHKDITGITIIQLSTEIVLRMKSHGARENHGITKEG